MTKLLFWGLIVLCALVAMRLAVRRSQPPPTNRKRSTHATTAAESMVACAHCGLYLPRSDALLLYGQTWCCQEHADQHRKA